MLRALPAMMFVGGIGLAAYAWDEWRQLPTYSDADVERSVDRNLAIDLARMGPQAKLGNDQLDQMRAEVREEVLSDIASEKSGAQKKLGLGLVAMVLGLGQMIYLRATGSLPK